ncbi:hypothetical protein CISIN_1g040040mg, partial [Citrus sinensis]
SPFLALTTITRALKNKSVPEWENVLQELQRPSMKNFQGVLKEACSTIELHYKYLKGEKLKKIFLLCSCHDPTQTCHDIRDSACPLKRCLDKPQEKTNDISLKLNASICLKDKFFTQLKGLEELWLDEVQGVENVVYELDREGFPSLKLLHIQNNPYLLCINDSTELVPRDAFPLLESLSLSNLMNLEKISCSQLRAESFLRLRNLKVESCEKLTHIFSFSISRGLPQLQTIKVTACKNMKVIFEVGREDDINNTEVIDKIEFSQLRKLTLKSLPQLRSFCSVVAFPNLETLKLSAINSETIWHNQLPAMSSCIQNLTRLIVHGCNNLKFLFSTSLVRSFVQLQHLEIRKCMDLEGIVFPEEMIEEERKDIVFPQLNFLKMKDLAKLTRFCSGNCIELPSLKQLRMAKCPELKAFILQNINTDMTVVGIQSFFNEKSFCKLKLMEVIFCKSLWTIFPHNMFARFLKLQSLIVGACGSLEEIFNLQELNSEETHSGAVSRLRELHVFCLPKLTKIWNKDPRGKLIFPNLVLVRIFECQRLKSIFPTSVEIVANDVRGNDAATKFIFPSLTFLKLRDLPYLTTFYSGMHTLECPERANLIFQLKNPSFGSKSLVMLLCLIGQQVFPNLEELTLSKYIFTTWRQAQFHKLKILHFISDGSDFFQVGLLQNIHNLEKLVLKVEEHAEGIAQIKSLKLNKLWFIKEHLWNPDSKLDSFLQNLEFLEVKECALSLISLRIEIVFSKLKWLFLESSGSITSFCSGNYAISFPSLEVLIVENCPKLNTFSAGVLKTPRLRAVQNWKLDEDFWAGDVNTTLQHLNEKMAKRRMTEVEYESETSMSEENEAEEEEENVGGDPSVCLRFILFNFHINDVLF